MIARRASLVALLSLCPAVTAYGQLRVVTFNTLDKPNTATELAQVRTIFDAIAATPRNGIAKRPDIIGLQEQRTTGPGESTATQIADELNDLFGVTSYEGIVFSSGNDLIGAVYDTATVSLESTASVFTGGPRATRRLEFQPVGYSSPDATLYTYVSHLKAGSSTSDRDTREEEARRIRLNADTLGSDANILYQGDFNMRSFEAAYTNFRAAGDGQAIDPLGLGSWPNSGVAIHLTQSTRTASLADGGATGGLDDRFDIQLVTNDLLDGEGLTYLGPTSVGLSGLEHSNQAFGNDGNTYNTRLTATFANRSQSPAVIQALHDFSDHLPVVADYQLPAVLGVEVDPIPLTLELGEAFALDVAVSNDADVVAGAGADELDYLLSTSGDLGGAFSGALDALAGDTLHQILLDTSSVGMKSGTLTVASTSEAAANALFQLPITYEVIEPLLVGDYNDDGVVDAADYTLWRDGGPLENEGDEPGVVNGADYVVWRDNFGATGNSTAVPEPAAWLIAAAAVGGAIRRR